MRSLREFARIFVCVSPMDMRKSINGLSICVEQKLKENVFDEHLFVFCNRHRNLLKILYWDKTGFALWSKRLEKDRFKWPKLEAERASINLTHQELDWLLSGCDISKIKPHKNLSYQCVS